MDGGVLGWDLYAIVPDVDGDESWRDVEPEFVRNSRRACLVMGVWCSRSTSSSTSARRLSSAVSLSSNAYLHSGPRFARCLLSFFGSLKRSGFFTLSSGSGCIDSSEDVVDEDLMRSTSACHDVGSSWRRDREWVAFTLVDGLVTSPTFVGVSGTAQVEVSKSARVVPVIATSVAAVAVCSSLPATFAVGMTANVAVAVGRGDCGSSPRNTIAARRRRLFPSCLSRAWRSCSRANSVTSFVIRVSRNLSAWVQVNPYGMGAVWRQPGGFRSGEINAALCDCIENGYWCDVEFECKRIRGSHRVRG